MPLFAAPVPTWALRCFPSGSGINFDLFLTPVLFKRWRFTYRECRGLALGKREGMMTVQTVFFGLGDAS